jgi:hypothetical protein
MLLVVEKMYTAIQFTKVTKGNVCALSVLEEKIIKVYVI